MQHLADMSIYKTAKISQHAQLPQRFFLPNQSFIVHNSHLPCLAFSRPWSEGRPHTLPSCKWIDH